MALTKLHDLHKRRKSRNVGLGLVLGLFVVLIVGLTIVKVSTLDPEHGVQAEMRG
jgi:uncharacterized membrane protein